MNKTILECCGWNVKNIGTEMERSSKASDWVAFRRMFLDLQKEVKKIEKEII